MGQPGWSCASQIISSFWSTTEKQCERPGSSGSIAWMSANANLRSARSLASGMRPGGKISKPRADTLQNSWHGVPRGAVSLPQCCVVTREWNSSFAETLRLAVEQLPG